MTGEPVEVHILTGGLWLPEVEIGSDVRIVMDEGLTVTGEVNDMFDTLQPHSARISLLSRCWMPELFGTDFRDVTVHLRRGGETVFAGFLEPQSYSQPFVEEFDRIDLNCIDALSALSLAKYRDADSAWADYALLRAEARVRPLSEIAAEILEGVLGPLDIFGEGHEVIFDTSRLAAPEGGPALERCGVDERLFLGDSQDEVWTQQEVLSEILRWADLHAVQDGLAVRIFGWDTARKGGDNPQVRIIDTAVAAGDDACISRGDVFNRIELQCEVTPAANAVENPLDSDDLDSPYVNGQLYMSEGIFYPEESDFDRSEAWALAQEAAQFHDVTHHTEGLSRREWRIRMLDHPAWTFFRDGSPLSWPATHQESVPGSLATGQGCALIRWSSSEKDLSGKDNAPVNESTVRDALVISVNGNPSQGLPTAEDIRRGIPRAEYSGSSAGNITPSDDDTVNYIVFSGNIVLNPVESESLMEYGGMKGVVFPAEDRDGKSRYVARAWWGAETPRSEPELIHPRAGVNGRDGLLPFTDDFKQQMKYEYSAPGSQEDTVGMVEVLACMLVIGDKCAVSAIRRGERVTEWVPFREREECADDDEYYSQCFFLGFDPKPGDFIIGQEYPVANNIFPLMGIDASGFAIPVRKSDGVSGSVRFAILGPVNMGWNKVTRRHRTWFRSEKWTEETVRVLPEVSNIQIFDFEAKIFSDNALAAPLGSEDLAYISYDGAKYTSVRTESLRIHSALTAPEREALKVSETVALSTVIDMETGAGVTEIFTAGAMKKPEEAWVEAYYRDHRQPFVTMELTVRDSEARRFGLYRHPAMPDRTFHTLAISRDLLAGTALIRIREVAP